MRLKIIGPIGTLALGLLAEPLPAEALQAGKMPRIGYLSRGVEPGITTEVFLKALRDLGWIAHDSADRPL